MKEKGKRRLRRILCIIGILLVLEIIGTCICTVVVMRQKFGRGEYPDRRFTAYWDYSDYEAAYPRENVQFQSGDVTLQGYIYGADNDKALLVFAHGIGAGHEQYLNQLLWYVDRGWRVFAYDATGSGHSGGDGTRGLVQSVLDLDAALTFAEQDSRLNTLPVFTMGHSWGGYAAAAILEYDHKICASASLAGYAYPVDMLDDGARGMFGKYAGALFHPFAWGYNKLIFGADADRNAVDAANSCTTPLYVVHGDHDGMIPHDTLGIYGHRAEITNPNAEFHLITGEYAGHNKILYSEASHICADQFNAEHAHLSDEYPDGIPDDVRAAAYASADQKTLNEPNAELLSDIETFYLANLPE